MGRNFISKCFFWVIVYTFDKWRLKFVYLDNLLSMVLYINMVACDNGSVYKHGSLGYDTMNRKTQKSSVKQFWF